MTSVSARSYVAAGLATAIAGVAVASPVLAQSQFHLPAVSGNVELASEVSSADAACREHRRDRGQADQRCGSSRHGVGSAWSGNGSNRSRRWTPGGAGSGHRGGKSRHRGRRCEPGGFGYGAP